MLAHAIAPYCVSIKGRSHKPMFNSNGAGFRNKYLSAWAQDSIKLMHLKWRRSDTSGGNIVVHFSAP